MRSKIRSFLGIESSGKYVKEHLDFANMRSGIFMCFTVVLLEIWMIVLLLKTILLRDPARSTSWIVGHTAFYLALMFSSLVLFLYSYRGLKNGKNNHRMTVFLCGLFAATAISFGLYISYFDYIRDEQIFTFVSMLVFVLCLLVWSPIIIVLISTGSFLAMYGIMYYVDGASRATQINLFVMWICVTMCGLANHYQNVREALKSKDLEEVNKTLKELVMQDPLTGLQNRNGLRAEIPDFLNKKLILLIADVDNFKYINDTYGHEMGDEVLIRITELLRETFRVRAGAEPEEEHIHCYRFGGDELIILAEDWEQQHFESCVKEWQEKIYKIGFKDSGVRVLTSCGYVTGTAENEKDISDMIRFADRKVYEAKHLGRLRLLGDTAEAVRETEERLSTSRRMLTETERDTVTDLPNTLYFREHADKLLTEQGNDVEAMLFLYFDIKNFKDFNEKYGFRAGDSLLKRFAEQMDEIFEGSLIARISDDHFIILAYEEGCREKVAKLRTALHDHEKEVPLELKVGLYMPERGEKDASICCDRARIACNSIKHSSHENYRVFDNELEEGLRKRHYILQHINDAVENGWIRVFYQPIVWLENSKICALEALARWMDPTYGLISPADFIEVLEEERLIHKLDQYVVRQVCQDLKERREDQITMIPVSLNFSRLDFELCDMVSYLEETAKEFGIPRAYLEVEITETALTDHPEYLEEAMKQFKEKGFRLWLDDFGSGYSSLNVLKDFDFDVLKIDMKFLSDFGSNEKSRPILNNVVRLANDISILPLTEGVETSEQAEFLHEIGCKRAQGYYYGKPMEKEKLKEFLSKGELLLSDELMAV